MVYACNLHYYTSLLLFHFSGKWSKNGNILAFPSAANRTETQNFDHSFISFLIVVVVVYWR